MFSSINLIFFRDFLQFPAVSYLNRYMNKSRSQYALRHDLWRNLNIVVILRQQMPQAEDLDYIALLQRVCHCVSTENDIVKLNKRVYAPLPHFWNVSVIVCCHSLRHVINRKRVQQASILSGIFIIYCIVKVREKMGMTLHVI